MFFIPMQAKAGLFSFVLSDEAHAQTDGVDSTQSNKNTQQNSQTVTLLQANVSSASILQDGKDRQKDDKKTDKIDPNATVNIVSDNAILPATGPMGVLDGTAVDSSSLDPIFYVVREGDTVSSIAKMLGVSDNTILWANDMKKGDKLVVGDVLFILPFDGRVHKVSKGQTLQSIAKLYEGVDVNDIITYNDGLTIDSKLAVGDELMIPGGNMADEGGDKPAPNLESASARDQNYYATHPLQNLVGYFINPVPTGHKTQGLHGPGKRGIDIGAPRGTLIYASASGTVIIVKNSCVEGQKRCGGGYGNYVVMQHPNGTKTLYGHMSKVLVYVGKKVEQGEIIGYVGSTGKSTGPHIHAEVFYARNPGVDWSWKPWSY